MENPFGVNLVDISANGFSALLRKDDFLTLEDGIHLDMSSRIRWAELRWSRNIDDITVFAGFEFLDVSN